MSIKSNLIHWSIIGLFIYCISVSFFSPLLNANDLYIVKYTEIDEIVGYIFKIENQTILISYIFVLLNLLIFMVLFFLIIKKRFTKNIEISLNIKKNFIVNLSLLIGTIIMLYLKYNNSGNENLYHVLIQLLFFHSFISAFLLQKDNEVLSLYYLLISLSIILYKILVSAQIFIVYLFFISSIYFLILLKVNLKKIIIYLIFGVIILFSLNVYKIYLRDIPTDQVFEDQCNFLKVEKKDSCGTYVFSNNDFKNEIVPVPPSTFKIIYAYPKNKVQYQIFTVINRGFERLLKMNYLTSNVSSMNGNLGIFNTEFLNGETYKLLMTKFIPRIVYPNKPSELWGQKYAKNFNFLPTSDTTTSINLDSISESYINFGFYGAPIYPFFLICIIYITFLIMNKLNNEFKILILTSIPVFIISSLEGNTSGWIGGFVTWILLISILNFAVNNKISEKILDRF